MPTYHYRLIADIEVDAPNIQAAEIAVKKSFYEDRRHVRALGSYVSGIKLPSQRKDERACRVEVKVSPGDVCRVKDRLMGVNGCKNGD